MLTIHRMILEPGCAVLPPHHQPVVGMLSRVYTEAAQHGLLELRPWGADGQHDRRPLLPGGEGYNLVDLLVDAAGLVDDGEGEVQSLEPLRHGREDLERRPAGGYLEPVGVEVN